MRPIMPRVLGVARVATALTAGAIGFYLADYIVRNHPSVTDRLQARENAANVTVARTIYQANGWAGFDVDPDAADTYAGDAEHLAERDCIAGFCMDPPGADGSLYGWSEKP